MLKKGAPHSSPKMRRDSVADEFADTGESDAFFGGCEDEFLWEPL